MASPAFAILFSAQVSGVTGVGAPGDVLVESATTGVFVLATAAARGSRRATGVALQAYANNSTVEIQQFGQIDPVTANVGAGTASWVRVSTTGRLERCTPSGSDDVCGWVEADGTFRACFGVLTAGIVNGSGGGSTTTTGTGYWHNTTGVLDGAATALTFTGDTTGTGTGASIALTTVKVNGASVPAAGGLTTGNIPQVSGASALTYGPLNLAGGANFVTGTLPVGNVGAPTGTGYPHVTAGVYDAASVALTWTGDATGTGTGASFALTVVKVNGASVPAAGALTTGNAAYVSGASALAYSALNLAGGAGWVTGTLPIGNVASPSGTGLAKVSGGAWVGAAALLVDVDVNAAAAIAGTKISPNFGSQAIVTTGSLSVGATPAAGGLGRYPNNANIAMVRNAAGTADIAALTANNDNVFVGTDPSALQQAAFVGLYSTSIVRMVVAGSSVAEAGVGSLLLYGTLTSTADLRIIPNTGNVVTTSAPIRGDASPYSVHGGIAVRPPSDASYTLSSTEYTYNWIELDLANWTGTHLITVPAPATKAFGYAATFYNLSALRSATISTGVGGTVTVAPTQAQRVWVDDAGVRKLGAAFSP